MQKNILFVSFIVLQFFTNNISAQLQHKHNISSTDWKNRYAYDCDLCQKNAEFVFEGKEIAHRFYASNDSLYSKTLLSRVIRITKVFRGKLNVGNIESIEESEVGILKNHSINSYEKELVLDTCSKIYFCNSSQIYFHDINSIGYLFKNKAIIESCTIYEIHDNKCKRNLSRIIGFDSVFISKASLYNYLRNEYTIKIPEIAEEPCDTIQSPYYFTFRNYYREKFLNLKETENKKEVFLSDSERVVVLKRQYTLHHDSLDSITQYRAIIKEKTTMDSTLKANNSNKKFEFYWDATIRKYKGQLIDPIKVNNKNKNMQKYPE